MEIEQFPRDREGIPTLLDRAPESPDPSSSQTRSYVVGCTRLAFDPQRNPGIANYRGGGTARMRRTVEFLRPRAILSSVLLVAALVSFSAPAAAGTACAGGYGWMNQYTSSAPGYYNYPASCSLNSPYYGWLGIDGEIDTPTSVTPLTDSNTQHDLGHIAMAFDSYGPLGSSQIQIGFYTGRVSDATAGCQYGHCVSKAGSYGLYLETYYAPTKAYSVYSYGDYALNHGVIFRIEHDHTNGCWDTYSNYSFLLSVDCEFPQSGAGYMAREIEAPGYAGSVPTANFGSATAGTNNALRLHNATTWEPWDTGLAAQGTATSDLRNTTPPYYLSPYANYYHVKTFGG